MEIRRYGQIRLFPALLSNLRAFVTEVGKLMTHAFLAVINATSLIRNKQFIRVNRGRVYVEIPDLTI